MGKLLLLSSVSCTLVTPLTTKKKIHPSNGIQVSVYKVEAVQKWEGSSVYNQFAMQLPFSRKMQRMLKPSSNFFSVSAFFFFLGFLVFVKREIHQPNNCGNTTQMQLIHFLLEFAESLNHQLWDAWSALFIPKQASSHWNCGTQQFQQLLHSPWHVRMVKEYSTMKIWIMVRSLTTCGSTRDPWLAFMKKS